MEYKKITKILVFFISIEFILLTIPLAYSQEPDFASQCVNFKDWEDRQTVASTFVKNGFEFLVLGGSAKELPVEKVISQEIGIQLWGEGIRIRFPHLASRILLHTFSRDSSLLTVTVYENNRPARDVTLPFQEDQEQVSQHIIRGRDINGIRINNGQTETFFLSLCIEFPRIEEVPEDEPVIQEVLPSRGRCGTRIIITVRGEHFRPGFQVDISNNVETSETRFINANELRCRITIPEEVEPGPRYVRVIKEDQITIFKEDAFFVDCPGPMEKNRPDLQVLELKTTPQSDGRTIEAFIHVKNIGNEPSPPTVLRVSAPSIGQSREIPIPRLGPDQSTQGEVQLPVPAVRRSRGITVVAIVDPENQMEEWNEGNNQVISEIQIPAPGMGQKASKPDDDKDLNRWLPLIGGGVALFLVFCMSYSIIRTGKRRKEWQTKAREKELPDECTPCTYYCRKIETHCKPALQKVVHLDIHLSRSHSRETIQEVKMTGPLVKDLNRIIFKRRLAVKEEKLKTMVFKLAERLLGKIMNFLGDRSIAQNISLSAHLVGSAITFSFILYHCKRKGSSTVWKKVDEWKRTFKDETDEPFAVLKDRDQKTTLYFDRLVQDLFSQIMTFSKKFDFLTKRER